MKRFIKKAFSIVLSIVLIGSLIGCEKQSKNQSVETLSESVEEQKEIILWYTNEELSNYINEVSKEFETDYNVIVHSKLVSAMDYIESINQAVLNDEAAPDLFISENNNLEKIYLAGLALESSDDIFSENNYFETSLDAFTYKGKILAYPMYFETSYLLYNQKYVQTPPNTIDEILTFANEFDAPEEVESIFSWDVTDLLCNYFFIGNYLNNDEIDCENYITNKDKITQALEYYQNLNQYFAIDPHTVDYESAFQNFIDGKSVFTIAKTDKLPEIEIMEGDASENEETIKPNEGTNANSSSNEEGNIETKENETSKEEQENAARKNREEITQNNQTDNKNSEKESSQTQKSTNCLKENYSAGVEEIFRKTQEKEKEAVIDNQDRSRLPKIIDKDSNIKVAPLPNLTDELESKGISIHYGVFINGYTKKEEEAKTFAKYLTYDKAVYLYQKAGKLSTRNSLYYQNDNITSIINQYKNNAVSPKVMENEDYWLKLEIDFSNVWKGANVAETVNEMLK